MHNRYAQGDIVVNAALQHRGLKLLHECYDGFFKIAASLDIADMAEGSVECPVGWFAVIDMRNESLAGVSTGYSEVHDAVVGSAAWEGPIPSAGVYFTAENEQGLIWAYECPNIAVAHDLFDECEKAYDEWDRAENGDDGHSLAKDEED